MRYFFKATFIVRHRKWKVIHTDVMSLQIIIMTHSLFISQVYCVHLASSWVNARSNSKKFHWDNTKSLLSLNRLSTDGKIDNANKELDGFFRSFVTGCLHNVHFFFFPAISWTLRRSLGQACRGRGADTHRHKHVHAHTHTCAAQHRTRLSLHKQRQPVPEWDVRPRREASGSGEQKGDVGLNTVTAKVPHDLSTDCPHMATPVFPPSPQLQLLVFWECVGVQFTFMNESVVT